MTRSTAMPDAASVTPRRRRRGLGVGILIGVLVVVVGGVVLADVAARAYATDQVERQLASRLPAGSGPVAVKIGGFSFLQQYLAGSFDTVELSAPSLAIGGVTGDAEITAHGVPTEMGGTVREASGSFTIGEDAVNALLVDRGLTDQAQLVDGAVQYESSFEVFGMTVGFRVTLEPRIDGDVVTLSPTSIEGLGSAPVDISAFIDEAGLAIPICAAELLPAGVQVTGIAVTEGQLRLDVAASDLPLTAEALTTTGSCGG
ncbi:DUF2993 domain-containing protein [Salinibacterium sp. ZJ454]|uniref:LmeA family phospholipid-binding protein n=1 Tax=Salinibacterium sp. ZJ454 TaxID=2708339 RepID=UPI00141FD68C|nr:DUF2993 domain-containing protein [Salinibacterium sp. ZJ454]